MLFNYTNVYPGLNIRAGLNRGNSSIYPGLLNLSYVPNLRSTTLTDSQEISPNVAQRQNTDMSMNMTPEELAARKSLWSDKLNELFIKNGQYDTNAIVDYIMANPDLYTISDYKGTQPLWEGATRNSRGFLMWNRWFNSTGLNKIFGYEDDKADYYGPTTAARKAVIDEYNRRMSLQQPPVINNDDADDGPDLNQNNQTIPNQDYSTVRNEELPQRQKQYWTGGIPIAINAGLDLMNALRLYDLEKQKKFPLQEAPYLQHKVTNNYLLRSQMMQEAANLRSLGAMNSRTSDLVANMQNLLAYDDKASQIETQANAIKADTYNKEIQEAEKTNAYNKLAGIEVANNNVKSNAAAFNNLLDARANLALRRNQAITLAIDDATNSYQQYVLDEKLNDLAYVKGINTLRATKDQQYLYNNYLNLKKDPYASQEYNQFKNYILNGARNGDLMDWIDQDQLTNNQDEYIKSLWDTDKADSYRNKYNKRVTEAYYDYIYGSQNIGNQLTAANLVLNPLVSDNGFYFGSKAKPTYQSLYQKRGGKMSRFNEYMRNKIQADNNRNRTALRASQLALIHLDKELERLSRELLLLLKSVFK